MEPSEIQFLRAPCFLFFENLEKICHFWIFNSDLILSTFFFLILYWKSVLKIQKWPIFSGFSKNQKHGALRNSISEGSMFFVFWKSWKNMPLLNFLHRPNFVNISIFHILLRVLRDIQATSCMLPYKCHTYLKSLWSLVFVGISQHDAMYIKVEENWVLSPKPDFCNFLTVSDIFQRNAWNLVKSYPNKLPNGSFFN